MPATASQRSSALWLLLAACGADPVAQTTADEPGTTSSSTTTTEPTTTTGDTPTSTGDETGAAANCGPFAGPCSADSICLQPPGGDYADQVCIPNPDGCVVGPECAPTCEALCFVSTPGFCSEQNLLFPHVLHCDFFACDPFAVDPGCPEGLKCNPAGHCGHLALDPLEPGETCTNADIDPCVMGAHCAFGDTGMGTCRPLCTGSAEQPMCPPDSDCGKLGLDIFVCLPTCDPLAPDCPTHDACVPNPNGDGLFACALDISGDAGALFSPCEVANACDPGLFCSEEKPIDGCDPDIYGCCLPYCDLDAPTCPDMSLECTPWHTMGPAPPGLEHVGRCAAPP